MDMKPTLFLAAILFTQFSFAQDPGYFIDQFKDNSNQQVLTRLAVHDSISKLDTVSIIKVIGEMEKSVAQSSVRMKTKVAALKSRLLFYKLGPGDSLYAGQMKNALYKANELDESFMIAEYSRWYSEMLNSLGKRNEAVQYALNAIVLQEQLGLHYFPGVNIFYFTIGELLFRTRNREEAVTWLTKGLSLPGTDSVPPVNYCQALNNLALSYYQLKDYKKSLATHERCMAYSDEHGVVYWRNTSYFNRMNSFVQLHNFDSSKVIVDAIYKMGKEYDDNNLLAGACFTYGQIANLQNDYTTAVTWLKKSQQYFDKGGMRAGYANVYQELSTAYNGLKQFDKSLSYYKKFQYLRDSAQKAEASERSDYMMAKANFDKEQLDFRKLTTRKAADVKLRNISIIILVLLSAIIILWLNWKRRRARYNHHEAEKQLRVFREEMIGKNQRIETLVNELQNQENTSEKAVRVEELAQQIILTEEDWQRFQSMFNKVYPGFFHRLREKAAGITEAELRLASLIKIQLNTRQIAAMQGISSDAVHKTRQRLRQRFSTASTAELEAIIIAI
jgi:tetratricopeptide (TPR) repeat protein